MTSAQRLGPEQRRRLRALAEHLQSIAVGQNAPAAPADPVVESMVTACLNMLTSTSEPYDPELHQELLQRATRLPQTLSDSASQERLFRQVVDYAPNGKLVISNDGVITYANRQAARIFGYQIEELIGKPVEVLVPADIRTRHVGLRLNYASDPKPRPMGAGRQLRGVRKDGSEVPIEIGLSPVDLPTGPAVMAAIVDISDRVRAEALQQEILRQQRELIEGLPQLVWTCRADGSCDFLGRQWVAYTGIPEAEQLGSGWLAQVHPDDRGRLMENWQQSFSTGASFDVEFRIRRHDGVYRWFKTRATQLCDAEGKVARWFGTNTDIDEQKQLERFLRERTTELERSNRDLEHFAFAASHDLREPLRKVRTFSTMISGLLLPEQQEAQDLVQRMDRAGQRMQALVDGLLTYSRLRSTRVSWSLVDLDALVTDVRDDLALAITEQGALIEVGPLGHLRGDRGQLYSLFLNLMSNAIKFHAPQVPPHLTISAERTANRLVVQWRDRGLGFPDGATRQAFELFTRFHDTRQFQGSGLGLATARKVVELHGGVITLESKVGQGSCFTAQFPIEPAS